MSPNPISAIFMSGMGHNFNLENLSSLEISNPVDLILTLKISHLVENHKRVDYYIHGGLYNFPNKCLIYLGILSKRRTYPSAVIT